MAGIDRCIGLLEQQGTELFEGFVQRLERLRTSLFDLKKLHLVDGNEDGLQAFDYDRSKIVISTEESGMTGAQLSDLLRTRYHLEMEMDAPQYVTAITTIGDTKEGLARLGRALPEIDAELTQNHKNSRLDQKNRFLKEERMSENTPPDLAVLMADGGEEVLSIAQAEDAGKCAVRLEESGGLVSGEFVYLYPPGIPFLAPGERIPRRLPEQLARCRGLGLQLQGMADYTGEKIQVIES